MYRGTRIIIERRGWMQWEKERGELRQEGAPRKDFEDE